MNLSDLNPKDRFTSRANDYAKYRRPYPGEVIDLIKNHYNLPHSSVLADIGSGTGILTRLLLESGYEVYAIEPNDAMRQKAEKDLNNLAGFHSVKAAAENTGLKNESLDAITVANALHWLDLNKISQEFFRILKPRAFVFVIFNGRKRSTMFNDHCLEITEKYSHNFKEYINIAFQEFTQDNLKDLFATEKVDQYYFSYNLEYTLANFIGYINSLSMSPSRMNPGYCSFINEISELFNKYQHNGLLTIEQECKFFSIQK